MPRDLRNLGGLVGSALDRLEEATGQALVPKDRLDLLEQSFIDYRALARDVEDVGWSMMDYAGGQPQELRQESRRRIIQRARYVWLNDPQAGASVELMNDFCFGRGVPAPRCKDKKVQEVVDEAWNDPDNQEVLTSLEAQLALGTDLALQSNVFLMMFDDGEDGKVKLSILRHDDVHDVLADPERRHRLLWYVCRRPIQQSFDFNTGAWNVMTMSQALAMKPIYYQHWRNVELANEEAAGRELEVPMPPNELVGAGKVYHARINRYSEMKFGAPRFQRTLRWFTAYNDFVKARIDVAQASAAYIMKRKVRGSPTQLTRDAARLISRSSMLAQGTPDDRIPQAPPKPGSILEENESVSHEALSLPSGAGDAQADANIIRAPISAAERFSQAYFGDASNSNLATATSLELPILKAVENRQEVFEGIFRWFIDRVIERAVDTGRIPEQRDKSELQHLPPPAQGDTLQMALQEAVNAETALWRRVVEIGRVEGTRLEEDLGGEVWIIVSRDTAGGTHYRLVEAHEDQVADESTTARDLSYDISMPNPLRRMMADLVGAIAQIAQVFDPNNTNVELSRVLLTIALGEGLEVNDPADLVEKILPPGWVDPLLQAQMQAQPPPPVPPPDGSQFPPGPDGNAYSAPMNSTMPENQFAAQQARVEESVITLRGRDGVPFTVRQRFLLEAPIRGDETERKQTDGKRDEAEDSFHREVVAVALDGLDRERVAPTDNGGSG